MCGPKQFLFAQCWPNKPGVSNPHATGWTCLWVTDCNTESVDSFGGLSLNPWKLHVKFCANEPFLEKIHGI